MKKIIYILGLMCIPALMISQSLIGAWEAYTTADDGSKIRSVVTFADGFQSVSQFDAETGAFVSTNGGTWQKEGSTVTETVEFDTQKPDRVGSSVSFEVFVKENTMGIVGHDQEWTRIDDGAPGKLQGAWLMSGRVRDGQESIRDTNRPRKTMKILSGTRFQWIAYNTETKKFMGTGGGSYTTIDGKYTENIEFFSRDNTRVGASLDFSYELIDGKWHHSGKSSKGKPIHEIWSKRD